MYISNLPAIRRKKPAWNKGRIVGQKRPLKPKHVWAIRVRFEIAENHRDLALFNTAIDSKLRGCDLVVLKVADVYAAGQIKERTSVLQSKTQKPVRFELTEGTRTSLERWLDHPMMVGHEYLWPGRFHDALHISTRQYARLVQEWVSSIGLEPSAYEPHFEFNDADEYKQEIKRIRDCQKAMVSAKTSTLCPTDWQVDGSHSKGQTMINRQTRLTMPSKAPFTKSSQTAE